MRTAKEIRQYLVQQRWYKDFVRNVSKYSKNHSKEFLRGYYKENTISGGFFWADTMQGHDYWSRIENNFYSWYKRGGNNYEKRRY